MEIQNNIKNHERLNFSRNNVPDELKDEKYWARRRKNNLAAKRSRDARRMKENQIALRADFLERESDLLKKQVEDLKRENQKLKMKLIQYESSIKQ
jgi:leukemia factor-related protein